MLKVLLTRRIPGAPLELLRRHFQVDHYNKETAIPRRLLLSRIKAADALLCLLTEKVDAELLRAAPRLRMVASFSVGLDHVDLQACAARGLPVAHTPGVLTESCADFTWALMLAAARRLVEGDRLLRSGAYQGWDPLLLLGADLHGKTLGIVGFGRIGQAVARRARGFGMRVLYHDGKVFGPEVTEPLGAVRSDLPALLKQADFLTLHTVLDKNTVHLIGEKELRSMRPTAVLVNSSRGPIVDEAALVKALRRGWIAAAGLDVYEREPKLAPGLARLPNVVLAPHLASATRETREEMGRLAVQSLIDYLIHRRTPRNLANPEVLGASVPV